MARLKMPRRFLFCALTIPLLASLLTIRARLIPRVYAQQDEAARNSAQARTVLDAMIKAHGGDAWLNQRNRTYEGRTAAFFHGKPSGVTTEFWEFHAWPDSDRIEYTKHRDVVQIYTGREGWEITYKGKLPLPKDQAEDYLRRRDHSVETIVKTWLKDPNTILIYEGQHLVESHLADQVRLLSAQNDNITIQTDIETHLPLRRSFQWRDPEYKDKDEDAEEYDNYRPVDGFPTPFNITRFHNGDMVNERFLLKAAYNVQLPADEFRADAAALKNRQK